MSNHSPFLGDWDSIGPMRENTKELLYFAYIYQQKRGTHVWVFIIRVFDPRGQDITVDWAEFIAVDALTRDSGFDY